MKKKFTPPAWLLLALIISLTLWVNPHETRAKGKSVLDYYLALPEKYFICEMAPEITKAYRLKQIIKKNLRNGFILAKSEGYNMQVALFTNRRLKKNVIAVNVPCGAGCMCNRFAILQQSKNGTWANITAKIFPSENKIIKSTGKKAHYIIQYDLPELGLDICLKTIGGVFIRS